MTSTNPPVAEVRDVVMQFRGLRALDGVSLHVEAGEVLGLIGPNGSGKTTLLNVTSGVLHPTAGVVRIAGRRVRPGKPHLAASAGVGRTFQQIRLFNEMTTRENVAVGAVARGHRGGAAWIDEVLDRVALREHADRPAGTLAYGQQRRVEIARALAGGPRVLLLDEPAAGMNESESDDLLATIEQIRSADGCAVVVVDHDLRLIMRLCDRIHVLAEGRSIAEGTPSAIQEDPAVIAAYLGSARMQDGGEETSRTEGRA